MGYMRHHAIVVTSWDEKLLAAAHAKAAELFPWVSPVCPPKINNYRSFFVPPDGSKEGWDESAVGDEQRKLFLRWLDGQRSADGGTSLRWVEVQFGDDGGESVVTNHSDEPWRARDRGSVPPAAARLAVPDDGLIHRKHPNWQADVGD